MIALPHSHEVIEAMMNNWIPDQLFRYRPVSGEYFEHELKELKKNKVWLNFLDLQNDPFEGALTFEATSEDQFREKRQNLLNFLKRECPGEDIFPEKIRADEAQRHNLHARAFTENIRKHTITASFSKSCDNTLMWGHYAENFAGLCLHFEHVLDYDSDQLIKLPQFFPVQYWRSGPPTFSGFDLYSGTFMSAHLPKIKHTKNIPLVESIAHEKMKVAVTSKSADWAYEEEYRLVSVTGVPGYFEVPLLKLKGIIFGPRVKPSIRHEVISALGSDYNYTNMTMRDNSYGFDFYPIDKQTIQQLLK